MSSENKKIFRGDRKCGINVVTINGNILEPRQFNGLPERFGWGDDSLESRQLAYTLLAEVFDDVDIANRFYIELTDDLIRYMPKKWTLPESGVKIEVKKINQKLESLN